jgi:hypothetical protein
MPFNNSMSVSIINYKNAEISGRADKAKTENLQNKTPARFAARGRFKV